MRCVFIQFFSQPAFDFKSKFPPEWMAVKDADHTQTILP